MRIEGGGKAVVYCGEQAIVINELNGNGKSEIENYLSIIPLVLITSKTNEEMKLLVASKKFRDGCLTIKIAIKSGGLAGWYFEKPGYLEFNSRGDAYWENESCELTSRRIRVGIISGAADIGRFLGEFTPPANCVCVSREQKTAKA